MKTRGIPLVITSFLENNKNFQPKNKYPDSLSEDFQYTEAISNAEKGDPFALAQLGKYFYDQGRTAYALQFFQAAIDAEKQIPDLNLAYQIVACLPNNDPNKINYYYRSLEYDLSKLQKQLAESFCFLSSSRPRSIDTKKRIEKAVRFLLKKQGKNPLDPNFKDPMLAILLSGSDQNLRSIFGTILDNILNTRYDPSILYDNKKKKFFNSIKNNPDHFENVARSLSLQTLYPLFENSISHYRRSDAGAKKAAHDEARSLFQQIARQLS